MAICPDSHFSVNLTDSGFSINQRRNGKHRNRQEERGQLKVIPVLDRICASGSWCINPTKKPEKGIYCSPACKTNFYTNHLHEWVNMLQSTQSASNPCWIYLYYIQGTTIGYVGKDSTGNRLHDHERGRFPTTAELNSKAAEMGTVTTSMRWPVDITEHTLDWWERYYADKYRAEGWTLINRTYLSLGEEVPAVEEEAAP